MVLDGDLIYRKQFVSRPPVSDPDYARDLERQKFVVCMEGIVRSLYSGFRDIEDLEIRSFEVYGGQSQGSNHIFVSFKGRDVARIEYGSLNGALVLDDNEKIENEIDSCIDMLVFVDRSQLREIGLKDRVLGVIDKSLMYAASSDKSKDLSVEGRLGWQYNG